MEKNLQPYNRISSKSNKIPPEVPSSGYVTYRTKDEPPIFAKQKLQLNLLEDITHLAVSDSWLFCLFSHHVLLRLLLSDTDQQSEVLLEQYVGGYNVANLFLDPLGYHLIIILTPKTVGLQPELLYLHTKMDKPKRIDKFRGHEITAVAFNHNESNNFSTGPILLGTSKGLILETEFGLDGEKPYYSNWKQVFEINRDPPMPITGLQFYKVPNTSRYIVVVSTTDSVYKFQETLKSDEKLVLQNIFTQYMNIPEDLLKFRGIHTKVSVLSFNCSTKTKYPEHFAWLTEEGIFYEGVDAEAATPDFIKNEEIIPLPENIKNMPYSSSVPDNKNNIKNVPKAMILTDFHILLMYSDHITALCSLNQEIVYEENFAEKFGVLLNIIKDFNTGKIYCYTSKAIFRFKITNEQRDIWKIYLAKNDLTLAEYYAKNNVAHLDKVLRQKAENTFLEKNYIESANIFSETKISFEKVCLKFLQLEDKKPLMIYLYNRLNKLDHKDKTQITMLTIWLIELHLDRISKAKTGKTEEQDSFNLFMSNERVQECCRTNYTVIYSLIESHGDKLNLTNLTIANKDYESVVTQYINDGNLLKALETIKAERNPELFYKYCPILIETYPQKTIQAIIEQENLNPEKLIPTLICTKTDEHISQIIRYLEYAVYEGVPNVSIHNYLIKLLAMKDQEKLLYYLNTQGRDLSSIHYDENYALRVCEEHNAKEASVFLQCLLQLWESAVELALTFDIKLAKNTASQPNDPELKKKLWLRIAEHEVKRNVNVKEALKLLKECDLLKIEDILPFFNDFTKIDDFKTAICNALKEYNLRIQELQHDMDEAGKAAERVSGELQSLRNQSVIVSVKDQCEICEILILMRPFYLFPCGHKFHSDCLEKQIIPYLNPEENRKLSLLKSQLENLSTTVILTNQPTGNSDSQYNQQIQNNSREKIKMQIEDILAADCLFCGVMIDFIGKPFIEDDDWDRVNIDWQ
ncbi:vacuolar protein sorting-associated protein 18 homolog isoform X2 [Condylostylus longicornis]|uniref:vacuolar protein sorting-associated protein 18 homolog isoform X2 n=1 Tax=Condylostylus longicornis TaxID=2530218 RepID=UPI00244DEE1A|nr:vacuolar protein sorting-associated protein 18 homolog isoform X2 [Condylostylus longicornis]